MVFFKSTQATYGRLLAGLAVFWVTLCVGTSAHALPAFARQTGQNCLACHAGGQYPELTPYGRIFKLTGYTIGERAMPVSAMAVIGASKVANSDDPALGLNTPVKNGDLRFETGSLFLAGKVTDNIGAFTQVTYDRYATPNTGGDGYSGHTGADGMDIRYADQYVDQHSDVIYGVSLNNRPSIADPWNTAWAWMQYVPSSPNIGSNQYIDGGANGPPYSGSGTTGNNFAGVNGYLFLNRTFYAELGFYRTANGGLRFLNANNPVNDSILRGTNPYWRLAYNKEWGASSWMIGVSGMTSHQYDTNQGGVGIGDATYYQTARVRGIDSQYQYLLDPHTFTAQLTYQHQSYDSGVNYTTPGSNMNVMRAKATYVYQAKYGASYSYFNVPGGIDIATSGNTSEVFYMPIQNVRLGLQYTAFGKMPNVDTPSHANTLRFYVWTAF
jgi:hypothetical protein